MVASTVDIIEADPQLVTKAVSALVHHYAKSNDEENNTDLLATPPPLHVQICLQTVPKHGFGKPFPLRVPHSIHREDDARSGVCLFCKQSDVKLYRDLYETSASPRIAHVMGLETLRSDYADYAARRRLVRTYPIFLADDRIVPMLPAVLGRDCWHRPPLPIRIQSATAMHRAIYQTTVLAISKGGTCCSVRAGYVDQEPSELVENVVAIVREAQQKLGARKLRMQAVSVKLPDSAALPIWNMLPELNVVAEKKETSSETDQMGRSDDEDATTDKKKKLRGKSPLLNALKKQKETEKKEASSESKKEEDDEKEKRKRKNSIDRSTPPKGGSASKVMPEDPDIVDGATTSPSAKKAKKAKKSKHSSHDGAETEATVSTDNKKKDGVREAGAENAKVTAEIVEEKQQSKKKSKRKQDKISISNDDGKVFIAAKKYQGSKKGFVFHKGPEGLGYYVDEKPVVDPKFIESLLLSASRTQKRSKTNSSKRSKGRQGKRR